MQSSTKMATTGSDRVHEIASGLTMPVGVAYKDGARYVSAVDRIFCFDDIERHLGDPPTPVVVTDRLPKDKLHGWRYLAFGPDGKSHVAVGVPVTSANRSSTVTGTSPG